MKLQTLLLASLCSAVLGVPLIVNIKATTGSTEDAAANGAVFDPLAKQLSEGGAKPEDVVSINEFKYDPKTMTCMKANTEDEKQEKQEVQQSPTNRPQNPTKHSRERLVPCVRILSKSFCILRIGIWRGKGSKLQAIRPELNRTTSISTPTSQPAIQPSVQGEAHPENQSAHDRLHLHPELQSEPQPIPDMKANLNWDQIIAALQKDREKYNGSSSKSVPSTTPTAQSASSAVADARIATAPVEEPALVSKENEPAQPQESTAIAPAPTSTPTEEKSPEPQGQDSPADGTDPFWENAFAQLKELQALDSKLPVPKATNLASLDGTQSAAKAEREKILSRLESIRKQLAEKQLAGASNDVQSSGESTDVAPQEQTRVLDGAMTDTHALKRREFRDRDCDAGGEGSEPVLQHKAVNTESRG